MFLTNRHVNAMSRRRHPAWWRQLGLGFAISLFFACSALPASADDLATLSIEQLKNDIEKQHPAGLYILAQKLFASGQKDEAVFWYYAGQLRYRVYLTVNQSKLDPAGDPAVFSALTEEIGRPVNEYAFGDIPRLAKTIDAVIAWAREKDATSVHLWVTETNKHARLLYERCGFTVTAERQPLPSNPALGELGMTRPLKDLSTERIRCLPRCKRPSLAG